MRVRSSLFLRPFRGFLFALPCLSLSLFSCSPADSPPPKEPVTAPQDAAAPPPVADVPDASVASAPANPDDEAIAKAEKDFVAMVARLWPEEATALGLHDHDAELDPRDAKAWDAALDEEDKMLSSLKEKFAQPKASREKKIDLETMEHWLAVNVRYARVQRLLQRSPSLYNAPLNAIFQMTAREYAPPEERAKNVLARLEKIPQTIVEAKKNLLNPPKVWTEVAIEEAKSAKGFFGDIKPFLLQSLPNDKAHVEAALKSATAAFDDYAKYLSTDVKKRSNGGFSAGKDLFEFLLHEDFVVDFGADDLAKLGKDIFEKTDAQMTEVAKRIDPKAKSWAEVVAKLKKKHPKADDLLATYRTEVFRAKKFLQEKDAVPFPDGDDLSVIDTPPFQRSTITAAYDAPPPFDAKVAKGFFFVTPVDKTLSKAKQEEMLLENDLADVVNTSVHEAYPGHHLQLSFSRFHPSPARKVVQSNVFAEGWALYCEELLFELGYYSDEERLMQLQWTLARAARILIDVGLHVQNMSFEDGVKILTDKVHFEHELALSEVKRYTSTPTQPSSYLVGREKIKKMRDRFYTAKKGTSFTAQDTATLKAFHAELLAHGTIAPGMIEREMFQE